MHIFININVCIYIQIHNLHRNANDFNTVGVRSSKIKETNCNNINLMLEIFVTLSLTIFIKYQ